MVPAQQPIELIQARTLLARLTTPAFLVDADGRLVFYNAAAGELLGLSFEEAGPMERDEWGTRFEPLDPEGRRVPVNELPLAIALREQRAGHARLRIRAATGDAREIEVSAFPLVGARRGGEMNGGVAIFWPVDD